MSFSHPPSQSDGGLYVNTLKPTYNSVDLTEVELPDVESTANHNSQMRDDDDANMLHIVRVVMM